MKIGVVGLGLIGGSMAKAIKMHTEHTVLGMDIIESVVCKARLLEAIDEELTVDTLKDCDIVFLAMYPGDTIAFARKMPHILNGMVSCLIFAESKRQYVRFY